MEDVSACSCGGVFQSLGPEHIRTGEVTQGLMGREANAWSEGSIPGELFACSLCRSVRFCADKAWLAQRQAQIKSKQEQSRKNQQWLEAQAEKRIQGYMKDFAKYSRERLTKVAENSGFRKCDDEEREAARRLLEQSASSGPIEKEPWQD